LVLVYVPGPVQEKVGVMLLLPEMVGLKLILFCPGQRTISFCVTVKLERIPKLTEAVLEPPVHPPPTVTVYVPASELPKLFRVIAAVVAVNPFGPVQEYVGDAGGLVNVAVKVTLPPSQP
jgi:hypothetical protein